MIPCRKPNRNGFTLIELLVVIAILGVLMALLLPAIQKIREATNRVRCRNNLKQVGVALFCYEGAYEHFPAGGMVSEGGGYGLSWWVQIMPFLEEGALFDELDKTSVNAGFVGGNDWEGNAFNRKLLRDKKFAWMRCPSSSLSTLVLTTSDHGFANVMSATYVGISGATDHPSARDKLSGGGAEGRLSFGGVLVRDRTVRLAEITDGTTNTIIAGEQSGWCKDSHGNLMDCRSDCWHGFTMGPRDDGWDRAFNLTTVLHPVNFRNYEALGIPGNCGPNRPIQSAHQGGAFALYCDGSSRFLRESIDLQTFYNLANRDDGNAIDAAAQNP